jgi:transcriptional regulator with XRE-family HTH domain
MCTKAHLFKKAPMEKQNLNFYLEKNKISEFIKIRRKSLKITQLDLAKYCDLSREGILKIESGKSDIQLSTLVKISKILGFKLKIEIEKD